MPDAIDRIGPSVRPARRVVMRQEWRHLLFLHWEVPAEVLRPLVPAGLELDLWEGRAYVGLVPFTMQGIRPPRLPAAPWLSRFHETNVRTYVHVRGQGPGVWFFSLDAANPVAVVVARRWFRLPYHAARMSLSPGAGGVLAYASERTWPGPVPAGTSIRCMPTGAIGPAAPGTLDHFLIERYLLYTVNRGELYCGQVFHRPYQVQPAEVVGLEESLLAASGIPRPDVAPLAHYSRGVDVEVFGLEAVGGDSV